MYSVGRMALSKEEDPLGPQKVGSSTTMSSPWAAYKFLAESPRGAYQPSPSNTYEARDGRLSEPLVSALNRFLELLRLKIPRSLSAMCVFTWFIFTDASHEPGAACVTAGIGAVLVNSLGGVVYLFTNVLGM